MTTSSSSATQHEIHGSTPLPCPLCGLEGEKRPFLPGSRAVILAAGRGSRMADETQDRPKALLRVGSRSLLGVQLSSLRSLGVEQILIVAGYRAEQVQRAAGNRARIVLNQRWNRTNSLYSLWLARDWLLGTPEGGSVLVMNSDVLISPEILVRLFQPRESAFAYDSTSGQDSEHMKVDLCRGFLRAMSKDLADTRVAGENVGVLRFDAVAARVLVAAAEALLADGSDTAWLAAAVERAAQHVSMRAIDVSDLPWIEVDFPQDLRRARQEIWPKLRPVMEPVPLRIPQESRFAPEVTALP